MFIERGDIFGWPPEWADGAGEKRLDDLAGQHKIGAHGADAGGVRAVAAGMPGRMDERFAA